MKIDELMIGDWVYSHGKFCGDKRRICKEDFSNDFNPEPIPLTQEMLDKNGFKYVMETRSYVLDPTFIENSDGTFSSVDNSAKLYVIGKTIYCEVAGYARVVSYIHELQHILKICNIKKEIIL